MFIFCSQKQTLSTPVAESRRFFFWCPKFIIGRWEMKEGKGERQQQQQQHKGHFSLPLLPFLAHHFPSSLFKNNLKILALCVPH